MDIDAQNLILNAFSRHARTLQSAHDVIKILEENSIIEKISVCGLAKDISRAKDITGIPVGVWWIINQEIQQQAEEKEREDCEKAKKEAELEKDIQDIDKGFPSNKDHLMLFNKLHFNSQPAIFCRRSNARIFCKEEIVKSLSETFKGCLKDNQFREQIATDFVYALRYATKTQLTAQLKASGTGRRAADFGVVKGSKMADTGPIVISEDLQSGRESQMSVAIACKGWGAEYNLNDAVGQAAYYAYLYDKNTGLTFHHQLFALRVDISDRSTTIEARWGIWDGRQYFVERRTCLLHLLQSAEGDDLILLTPEYEFNEFMDRMISVVDNLIVHQG